MISWDFPISKRYGSVYQKAIDHPIERLGRAVMVPERKRGSYRTIDREQRQRVSITPGGVGGGEIWHHRATFTP